MLFLIFVALVFIALILIGKESPSPSSTVTLVPDPRKHPMYDSFDFMAEERREKALEKERCEAEYQKNRQKAIDLLTAR